MFYCISVHNLDRAHSESSCVLMKDSLPRSQAKVFVRPGFSGSGCGSRSVWQPDLRRVTAPARQGEGSSAAGGGGEGPAGR